MSSSPGELFEDERPAADAEPSRDAPLAERMRPRDLSEVEGPADLVGPNSFLAKALATDKVPSLVFWGPPGSGKTTLARIVARKTRARFLGFSAVVSGIKEIRNVMEEAARAKRQGHRTLLFVDEIHRFNRAQQDAFLPFVEAGDIVLVGATTENPSFELNGALLSRLRVVILPPLAERDLILLMKRALADRTRGLAARVTVDEDSFEWLGRFADGDARRALTALEAAVSHIPFEENPSSVSVSLLEDLFKRKVLLYDKSGEEHFNLISALHKSLRDSDVDASLYWLARMLEAGEDPLYVARRLVRFASEDVGLADPSSLGLAIAAKEAVHFIGMPEGALALAEIAVHLALAPKSNALYAAYGEAVADVHERPNEPPPLAIRNAPTKLMKDVGYGSGYRYAHDLAEKTAGLSCLPDSLAGRNYYRPSGEGAEKELKTRSEAVRALREKLKKTRTAGLAVLVALLLSKNLAAAPPAAPVGLWHAELIPSAGFEIFFDVKIAGKGSGLSASLLNGTSEIPFTSAAWDGAKLTLELANYDAKIVAELKSGRLEGGYARVVAAGLAEVPFRASRKAPRPAPAPSGGASIDGSWGVEMSDGKRIEKMTGVFRQKGGAVAGTFLSTTGDYGALHGTFDGERLVLSVFDGVHVYRYDAELLPDGTLAGEYRSRTNPPASWRGKRLDAVSAATFLPGSFDVVKPKDPSAPYVVSFPDVEGRIVSTADERFAGRPMLVAFMGTWCPNCADEAPVLRELYAEYLPKGLEVISLSFEYTDDVERNRRQVKRFIERFGTKHLILLAGTTKAASTSPAIVPLEGWEGYPTTLFLDRRHRIVKIHSGFDGPATGERFTKLKKELVEAVEALLRTPS